MASAEMPGLNMTAVTSTPLSKKQDLVNATPTSEKHRELGRRKLDEYRRRKREQKEANKTKAAAEESVSKDARTEACANGPVSCPTKEVNGGQEPSQSGRNGHDAHVASALKEGKDTLSQGLWSKQESSLESHEAGDIKKDFLQGASGISDHILTGTLVAKQPEDGNAVKFSDALSVTMPSTSKPIPAQVHGLKDNGHEKWLSTEASEEAESQTRSKFLRNVPEQVSRDYNKKSAGVSSDDSLSCRISAVSWKGSNGTSNTGLGLSIPNSASSNKYGRIGSKEDDFGIPFRSTGVSDSRRLWDSEERRVSFAPPKKSLISELQERREPIFSSKLSDRLLLQSSLTAQIGPPTVPAMTDHWRVSSGAISDQLLGGTLSDIQTDFKTGNQQEEKKKHDDFAALEQHIDELTQEKFALQRALEAARSLADSLTQQNSVLTEDFNSQGAIINQLQEDLEKKKEEITSQSLVLKSLMMERERAQQENNSAVERSQILAGEVIGLEEKVLKLRSSELKLQKELETLKVDKDSIRAQLTTLEKDRESLKAMLEVLQEDKKLLERELQTAIASVDNLERSRSSGLEKELRDAFTSTEDLVSQTQYTQPPVDNRAADVGGAESSSIPFSLPPSVGLDVSSGSGTLSPDDLRVINSIDGLITELFSEKQVLLESLRRESARAMEFETLNNELSKKLEMQTQRLELAVAQNMAYGENQITRDSLHIEPQANEYVDEGDEVVDRVLGWIMRIFPGGSARRQVSKRL
ncbi:hypothetical protein KP509_19G025300 [Ceratopteris richardii]|uniref:Uncharacterized protein n=1 Tax=Ceratopteris richardii TaxID=49495 RepID=A0A8T2SIX1_CERRI|nr:hypothetical protein KP509_19G025300 [Ceratopteris richardii]